MNTLINKDEIAQGPQEMKHIVIVEDSKDIAHIIERFVQKICKDAKIPMHINTYNSAEAALRDMPYLKPDLLITDINLHTISGTDMIDIINAKNEYSDKMKILIISADSMTKHDVIELQKRHKNITAGISKPVKKLELQIYVEEILG